MKPLNIYPKRDEFINGVSMRRIPEGVLPVMLAALPHLAEHVDRHRYVRSDVLFPALTLLKSGKVRPLLGSSTKVELSRDVGVRSPVLYAAAADLSGFNMCPWATASCRDLCLKNHGRLIFSLNELAQVSKTWYRHFFWDRYCEQLDREIEKLRRKCRKEGSVAAVRLDGTTETGDGLIFAERHPEVTFYDYCKRSRMTVLRMAGIKDRTTRRHLIMTGTARSALPANFHLTFSVSERSGSWDRADEYLANGLGAAVVIRGEAGTKESAREAVRGVLEAGRLNGLLVCDGDLHDARFLDGTVDGVGRLALLYAKGPRAPKDESGFAKRVRFSEGYAHAA